MKTKLRALVGVQKIDQAQVLKKLRNKRLYALFIIIWVACWSLWLWGGKETFEIGNAFVCFGFTLVYFLEHKSYSISKIGLAISCNQLADELFFDPFKISINEYTCMGFIILFILFNSKINEISDSVTI